MRLVLDANVLISALIKDGPVRAALRTSTDDLHTAWYVHVEINEHRSEIQRKSGISPRAYDALINELWRLIEVVPRRTTLPYLQPAARAMHQEDPDDTMYVATAIAIQGTVASNDQAFEEQEVVPHMWTSEFVERALGSDDEE